jgi:2-polyprenyl-6-methoxyphenol hydroxylase-like FAD-dependent oxidoreductase
MTEHAVVIVGGGPTGMMLGAELALAKVDVAIVERRAGQNLAASRSGGLLPRTIEVLDQRGVADRFPSEGQIVQVWGEFAGSPRHDAEEPDSCDADQVRPSVPGLGPVRPRRPRAARPPADP